jgi:hypothetical protein
MEDGMHLAQDLKDGFSARHRGFTSHFIGWELEVEVRKFVFGDDFDHDELVHAEELHLW